MGQSGKYFAVANGLGHVDDILREDVRIPQRSGITTIFGETVHAPKQR
jgi:hypothetical protein